MKIHICIVSAQPIPNLLPILLDQPDKVILIESIEMKLAAERLERILSSYESIEEVMKKYIESAFDFDIIAEVCEEIINSHDNAEFILNVTGGTKIAALAAFQTFSFSDSKRNSIKIIYCDTTNDTILQLEPEIAKTPIRTNKLKVHDYLAAYGFLQISSGRPAAGMRRRSGHLPALATLLIQDVQLLSSLNSALQEALAAPVQKNACNLDLNRFGEKGNRLASILQNCGCAEQTTSTNLNIQGRDNIFFCGGGWLEEYTYLKIRDLNIPGMDLAINVKVEWDGKTKETTQNEFDILFTHRNRLHTISCKTANLERETASGLRGTEAIYELDSLTDRSGGLFRKPMLLSARALSAYDRDRARNMGFIMIDGQEVLRLSKHLETWLELH